LNAVLHQHKLGADTYTHTHIHTHTYSNYDTKPSQHVHTTEPVESEFLMRR